MKPAENRGRWRLVVLAVAILAAAGLWASSSSPAGRADVDAVASTLRCPTCVAESVADSTAPMSASMRETIADQLEQGWKPDEIRAWFAQRYGDDVLLDPPRRGVGWPLWLLPFAVVPVAAFLILRRRRRQAWVASGIGVAALAGIGVWAAVGGDSPSPSEAREEHADAPLHVLEQAAEDSPGDPQVRAALARALDGTGRVEEAAEHYAAASRLAPHDDALRYHAAFALVRASRSDEAVPLLEDLLQHQPDHPEALLLLGSVVLDVDAVRGEELLRHFLDVAPDHPAAAQAEDMLAEDDP